MTKQQQQQKQQQNNNNNNKNNNKIIALKKGQADHILKPSKVAVYDLAGLFWAKKVDHILPSFAKSASFCRKGWVGKSFAYTIFLPRFIFGSCLLRMI